MKQVFPIETESTPSAMRSAIVGGAVTTCLPFSDDVIALCDSISRRLFDIPHVQDMSEIFPLAFFLREASLRKLKTEWFSSIPSNCVAMPRGRVLHIAPANVEIMFVYSWVVSMLCGNANVVRIPSKPSRIIDTLCQCMRESLKDFPHIASGQFGISYEANMDVTKSLSEISNVRIIWGGDETVRSIRSVDAPANLRDIIFPNRFSWAAIKSAFLLNTDEQKRMEFTVKLFNDSYLFDQRACSSPHILLFVGDNSECAKAQDLLMNELQKVVAVKGYSTDPSHAIEKLSAAALIAAKSSTSNFDRRSPELMSIATTYSGQIRSYTCGGGFFVILHASSLEVLADIACSQDQTLSYAGFSHDELSSALIAIQGRGFDRVVPIGQALQFEPIWDGMNLMTELTRLVRVLPESI